MRAIAVWIAATGLLAAIGGTFVGPLGALTGVGVGAVYLLAFAWVPRAAHRAFSAGEFGRARRLFAIAGVLRLTAAARRAARLSICACELGAGRWSEGLEAIEEMPSDDMAPGEKAVWKNNVAYALSRLEIRPAEALSFADEAVEARPALAGFRHTRGIALLASGRVDDAISALESVYSDEQTDGALEAERCYDLGRAWAAKGEHAYACDYWSRASRAANSPWADRAAAELAGRNASGPAVPIDGLV